MLVASFTIAGRAGVAAIRPIVGLAEESRAGLPTLPEPDAAVGTGGSVAGTVSVGGIGVGALVAEGATVVA